MKRSAAALTLVLMPGLAPASSLPTDVRAQIISRASAAHHHKLTTGQGATPLRTAQLKVSVKKFTLTKAQDGSYSYQVDDVCVQSAPINVFDARENGNLTLSEKDVELASCPSVLDGTPVSLHFDGYLALWRQSVFEDETMTDIKGTFAWMYANKPENDGSIGLVDSYSATREMGKTSVIGTLTPESGICAGGGDDCKTSLKEYFGATFEVTDGQ